MSALIVKAKMLQVLQENKNSLYAQLAGKSFWLKN